MPFQLVNFGQVFFIGLYRALFRLTPRGEHEQEGGRVGRGRLPLKLNPSLEFIQNTPKSTIPRLSTMG
jgi:hypothetical protein